jgi:hypothetical protein
VALQEVADADDLLATALCLQEEAIEALERAEADANNLGAVLQAIDRISEGMRVMASLSGTGTRHRQRVPKGPKGGWMARPCTVCTHTDREKIDAALLSGTPNRAIAGQYRVARSSVNRHRSHIGTALVQAAQRKAELEDDLGDDLLGQANALNRDLRRALEAAKEEGSLSAFLQVADRIQKQLALQ